MVVAEHVALRNEVHSALNAWVESVEDGDLNHLSQVVCHDPLAVWIGSGQDQWIHGCEQLKDVMREQAATLKDVHITVSEEKIHMAADESFAWATNQWLFEAKVGRQDIVMPLRCTWVLENKQDGWKLVHFHKSVGVSG